MKKTRRKKSRDTVPLRPPPLIGSRRGMGNFVGSDSGHIQSVEVLKNMVSNMTQQPPAHTVCIYLVTGRGGGRVELETMTQNTSWSKFQEKIANALASFFVYARHRGRHT
jgi:hypothetical protein